MRRLISWMCSIWIALAQGLTCSEWSNGNFQNTSVVVSNEDSYQLSPLLGIAANTGGRHALPNVSIPRASIVSPNSWVYPATEGQDKLVMELLDFKRNGYFIDLAARYWFKGSNTWALEYFLGWKGICIEPDVRFYTGLAWNRTCQVSCNNPITSHRRRVHFDYSILSAPIKNSTTGKTMYTILLDDVLNHFQAPSIIDYLSLDVEGEEFDVLKAVNLTKRVFLIMSIERPTERLHQRLVRFQYWWLRRQAHTGECIYVHESLPSFNETMTRYRTNQPISTVWRNVEHGYLVHPAWPKHAESASISSYWSAAVGMFPRKKPNVVVGAKKSQQEKPFPTFINKESLEVKQKLQLRQQELQSQLIILHKDEKLKQQEALLMAYEYVLMVLIAAVLILACVSCCKHNKFDSAHNHRRFYALTNQLQSSSHAKGSS